MKSEPLSKEDQTRNAAVIMDAVTQIDSLTRYYAAAIGAPMAEVCDSVWNRCKGELTDLMHLHVIPDALLINHNPEPDNPDSSNQVMYLPGLQVEPTEEDLANGVSMSRVTSPRMVLDAEMLALKPSDATLSALDEVLINGIAGVMAEVRGSAQTVPVAAGNELVCFHTRLRGHVFPQSDDPNKLTVVFYARVGFAQQPKAQ